MDPIPSFELTEKSFRKVDFISKEINVLWDLFDRNDNNIWNINVLQENDIKEININS